MTMKSLRSFRSVGLLLMLFAVAACNTVQGAGKDLESVGKAGEKALD